MQQNHEPTIEDRKRKHVLSHCKWCVWLLASSLIRSPVCQSDSVSSRIPERFGSGSMVLVWFQVLEGSGLWLVWSAGARVKFRKVPEVPTPGSGKGSEVLISVFIFPDQGWVKFRKVPEVPTPGSGKGSNFNVYFPRSGSGAVPMQVGFWKVPEGSRSSNTRFRKGF